MLNDAQVRLLRRKRMEGKTQQEAAAIAGMSERTARKWEAGPLPSGTKEPRTWRTRSDPFVDVWEGDLVPLLQRDEKGVLQAPTLMDYGVNPGLRCLDPLVPRIVSSVV